MIPNTVTGAIEVASQVKQAYDSVKGSSAVQILKNRSLIDVASVARVEPIMMVDADCLNVEALHDILQASHSMFAGYYLQAVNMVNTVAGVTVAERLAPFNPTAGGAVFEELVTEVKRSASMEAYRFKLPLRAEMSRAVAMEDAKDSSAMDASVRAVQEAGNLSVGKMFNVKLQCGEQSVVVPVAIRLMTHTIPSRVMADLFASRDVFDNDMRERYHAWRSGRIAFWKDLVLCNDLIDKRIKTSIQDPTGVLNTIRQRQSGNNVHAAISGEASVANATNLAIVSSDTMDAVEGQLGGPLKNAKVRAAVFESSNLMIIAVVNKHWERVTFWFRGLDSNTNLSYKDLKAAGKGDGSNVTDILKAYISGAAPSL